MITTDANTQICYIFRIMDAQDHPEQNLPITFAVDYKVGLSFVLDASSPFPELICYDIKVRLSVLG